MQKYVAFLICAIVLVSGSALAASFGGYEIALVVLHEPSQEAIEEIKEFVGSSGGFALLEIAGTSLVVRGSEAILEEIRRSFRCRVFTETVEDVETEAKRFAQPYRASVALALHGWNRTLSEFRAKERQPNRPVGKPLVGDMFVSPSKIKATTGPMLGNAGACVFAPESTGAIDPSTEDWTEARYNTVLSEIVAGLTWWSNHAADNGKTLNFGVYHYGWNSDVNKTSYEPINRPSSDQCLWINEIMENAGYYSGSDCLANVDNFNTAMQGAFNKDSFFSIFVVDSYNDSDGTFTDGYFAYAYLGGPFLVMTYDNDGWGIDYMDRVLAHEVGHIYHACDEYYSPGYAECECTCWGNPWMTDNDNCEDNCGADEVCLMRDGYSQATCYWTKGQIGWYTDVELSDFVATREADGVLIFWSTSYEAGVAGWNIYRAEEGSEYARLNEQLIEPYQYDYWYPDEGASPNVGYCYKLEAVNLSGSDQVFGPRCVKAQAHSPSGAAGWQWSNDDSPDDATSTSGATGGCNIF